MTVFPASSVSCSRSRMTVFPASCVSCSRCRMTVYSRPAEVPFERISSCAGANAMAMRRSAWKAQRWMAQCGLCATVRTIRRGPTATSACPSTTTLLGDARRHRTLTSVGVSDETRHQCIFEPGWLDRCWPGVCVCVCVCVCVHVHVHVHANWRGTGLDSRHGQIGDVHPASFFRSKAVGV